MNPSNQSEQERLVVFFYGLFMDSDILLSSGVQPLNPYLAWVDDFALRIGDRATLVKLDDSRAYGILYSLTSDDLNRLYGQPGLEDYRAETVSARILSQNDDGSKLDAVCYNLPQGAEPKGKNIEYAEKLQRVLIKYQFPRAYIDSIG